MYCLTEADCKSLVGRKLKVDIDGEVEIVDVVGYNMLIEHEHVCYSLECSFVDNGEFTRIEIQNPVSLLDIVED